MRETSRRISVPGEWYVLFVTFTVAIPVNACAQTIHYRSKAAQPGRSGIPYLATEAITANVSPRGGCGATCSIAAEIVPLSNESLAELGDPFGVRVFKDHATERSLSKILELLKNGSDQSHQIFVVGEWIRQTQPDRPRRRRRCVLSFDGNLSRMVMLSFGFDSDVFPTEFDRTQGVVEVWGWDDAQAQFHFYELADANSVQQWVHSGSSPKPTDSFPFATDNRCMECHLNGAPLMKELNRPWNNWLSTAASNNGYLRDGRDVWDSLKAEPLYVPDDAENLERRIESATKRFVRKLLDANQDVQGGGKRVTNLRRLLRHVFLTTEFNLTSSDTESGVTPFDNGMIPNNAKVHVPNSFFLNAEVISELSADLRMKANSFRERASFPTRRYAELVRAHGLRMRAQRGADEEFKFHSGFDSNFPWFVPEPGFLDNAVVNRMVSQNLVTRELVAAIQLVDLRNSVLSTVRESIFNTPDLIPDSIVIPVTPPADAASHPLTKHLRDELESLNPLPSTPQGRLLAILSSDQNPIEQLTQAVDLYLADVEADFKADDDGDQIDGWFMLMLDRRRQILRHPLFQALDETRDPPQSERSAALLPLP